MGKKMTVPYSEEYRTMEESKKYDYVCFCLSFYKSWTLIWFCK